MDYYKDILMGLLLSDDGMEFVPYFGTTGDGDTSLALRMIAEMDGEDLSEAFNFLERLLGMLIAFSDKPEELLKDFDKFTRTSIMEARAIKNMRSGLPD